METRCGDSWACLKSCAESGHMTKFMQQWYQIMVGAGFTGAKTGYFCRLLLTQHV